MNELERTDAYLRNRIPPLVPRDLVFEIDERIDVKGNVIKPLDEAQARGEIRKLKDRGIEAVAICTLWSTHNPVHEKRLREIVAEELPGRVRQRVARDFARRRRICAHVDHRRQCRARSARRPLSVESRSEAAEGRHESAGADDDLRRRRAADRGAERPAGLCAVLRPRRRRHGIARHRRAGRLRQHRDHGYRRHQLRCRRDRLGQADHAVGDFGRGRRYPRAFDRRGIDRRRRRLDRLIVEFGELRVGPRSAGANPGPACYGRGGTRPTATDADLVLGVLDPNNFIGGRMKLDVEAAATRAIEEHVAKPLGMSVTEAAWSIRQILDSRMADLLRRMTIERGYDPRDFTLLANGGAGPSHAWVLGEELGLDSFIVPAAATAESAYGTGNSDLGFTAERPAYARISPGAVADASAVAARHDRTGSRRSTKCRTNLALAGPKGDIRIETFIAIKFRGQTNHLDIPFEGETFTLDTFRTVTADLREAIRDCCSAAAPPSPMPATN